MASPQEGHIKTGVLFGTCAEHSRAGIEGVDTAWRNSNETGGSATGLSATDAWRRCGSLTNRLALPAGYKYCQTHP